VFILVDVFFYNDTTFPSGESQDIYVQGTVLFICILLIVTGKISLTTRYWVVWNHVTYWGGLVCTLLLSTLFLFLSFESTLLFGML